MLSGSVEVQWLETKIYTICMSKEHLIHRRTCIYNVNYHIVWSVKYRRKVLNAKIESYLKDVHSS
ncbi:transposase [Paradesulfitobacterium aromaticivorans]